MISTITIFVMTSSIAVGQPMLNSDWFSKTNDGPIENKVKCDKQSNNELSMAYEPGGEGLFRDPLEVLGLYRTFLNCFVNLLIYNDIYLPKTTVYYSRNTETVNEF